jgi:hypothetical protein
MVQVYGELDDDNILRIYRCSNGNEIGSVKIPYVPGDARATTVLPDGDGNVRVTFVGRYDGRPLLEMTYNRFGGLVRRRVLHD